MGNGSGKKETIPHDEAFKKLLQSFFVEFMELFFPDVAELMDGAHTRLLMQEQLVDVIGEEARTIDILVETKLRETEAYMLVLLEPQSYKQSDFNERMFIYFSRLFERHRKEHKLIVPIAIFTYLSGREEPDMFRMDLPFRPILNFRFFKLELRKLRWRDFIDSHNPVAAALLGSMGFEPQERKPLRMAFLKMLMQQKTRLDDARIVLLLSFAHLYFKPQPEEDRELLSHLIKQYPLEGGELMELMPAWKRWGYEEGLEEGMEKGLEQGLEQGGRQKGLQVARKLLGKGMSPEEVADTTELPLDEIKKLLQS